MPQLEEDAKQIRKMGVDLVVIAPPLEADAESAEQYIRSYSWVMNNSLSFGHQEWDCIAIPPSVARPSLDVDEALRDRLIRRLIRAQDLGTITRAPGDDRPVEAVLAKWLERQVAGNWGG